jgi:hypothetical protein
MAWQRFECQPGRRGAELAERVSADLAFLAVRIGPAELKNSLINRGRK